MGTNCYDHTLLLIGAFGWKRIIMQSWGRFLIAEDSFANRILGAWEKEVKSYFCKTNEINIQVSLDALKFFILE